MNEIQGERGRQREGRKRMSDREGMRDERERGGREKRSEKERVRKRGVG